MSFHVIIDIIEVAVATKYDKENIIRIINEFAAGSDGVLGTADDRLTEEHRVMLENMVKDGSIDRLVEAFSKKMFLIKAYKTISSLVSKLRSKFCAGN